MKTRLWLKNAYLRAASQVQAMNRAAMNRAAMPQSGYRKGSRSGKAGPAQRRKAWPVLSYQPLI